MRIEGVKDNFRGLTRQKIFYTDNMIYNEKSQETPEWIKKRIYKLNKLFDFKPTHPCCFCGKILTQLNATFEHIIPKSKGGSDHLENLDISCSICNNNRGSIDFYEWKNYIHFIKSRKLKGCQGRIKFKYYLILKESEIFLEKLRYC